MNEEHPSHELLDRLRRGGASRDEVLAVTKHLAGCADCREAARSRIDVPAAADALRDQIGDEHPDLERELFPYADGSHRNPDITAHLTQCGRCRTDVEDLRLTVRRPAARRDHHGSWIILAAAAAIAAVIVGAVMMREQPEVAPAYRPPVAVVKPSVTTTTPPIPTITEAEAPVRTMRPEWAALVERARGGESPAMPAVLRRLRRGADVLRGSATARALLAPAGIIVESQRPRFTWDVAGGDRFEVWLFAEGREVARSGALKEKAWTPQRPLRRGVTYTWELQVERNGESEVYPVPPAPPAELHVLDAEAHEELEEARREHAGDHLLLGLLYARAGLIDEAHAELGRVTAEEDVEVAKRLRDNLATWSVMS